MPSDTQHTQSASSAFQPDEAQWEEELFHLLRIRMERAAREGDTASFRKLDRMVRAVQRTLRPVIERADRAQETESASSSFDAL